MTIDEALEAICTKVLGGRVTADERAGLRDALAAHGREALAEAERAVRMEVHEESGIPETPGDWLLGMIRAADIIRERAAALRGKDADE